MRVDLNSQFSEKTLKKNWKANSVISSRQAREATQLCQLVLCGGCLGSNSAMQGGTQAYEVAMTEADEDRRKDEDTGKVTTYAELLAEHDYNSEPLWRGT